MDRKDESDKLHKLGYGLITSAVYNSIPCENKKLLDPSTFFPEVFNKRKPEPEDEVEQMAENFKAAFNGKRD